MKTKQMKKRIMSMILALVIGICCIVPAAPAMKTEAASLKDVAKKRGNKPTWVLYRLHELVEKRDLQYEERVIICRSLGYKPGFQYKMNEFLNPQPVTT